MRKDKRTNMTNLTVTFHSFMKEPKKIAVLLASIFVYISTENVNLQ